MDFIYPVVIASSDPVIASSGLGDLTFLIVTFFPPFNAWWRRSRCSPRAGLEGAEAESSTSTKIGPAFAGEESVDCRVARCPSLGAALYPRWTVTLLECRRSVDRDLVPSYSTITSIDLGQYLSLILSLAFSLCVQYGLVSSSTIDSFNFPFSPIKVSLSIKLNPLSSGKSSSASFCSSGSKTDSLL